jgi:cell division septation protein DedD
VHLIAPANPPKRKVDYLPRTEDGEFELILGNRQLLSLFFVMLVLLGVFFTMGYVVGRNSSSARVDVASRKATDTPATESHPPASTPAAPVVSDRRPATPSATEPARTEGRDASQPSPAASEPAQQPKEEQPVPAGVVDPTPGQTYLQVVAVARPDAELISETLLKRGFSALIAPGPKENDKLFRVLVGPLKDAAEMASVRTALEAAGFKNPVVRKY